MLLKYFSKISFCCAFSTIATSLETYATALFLSSNIRKDFAFFINNNTNHIFFGCISFERIHFASEFFSFHRYFTPTYYSDSFSTFVSTETSVTSSVDSVVSASSKATSSSVTFSASTTG